MISMIYCIQKLRIFEDSHSHSQSLRVFEGDPQKTLKANPHSHLEILTLNLKNIALILTSNFEGFRGPNYQKPQMIFICNPQPQKFSNFVEHPTLSLKDSRISRMRMRILV